MTLLLIEVDMMGRLFCAICSRGTVELCYRDILKWEAVIVTVVAWEAVTRPKVVGEAVTDHG